MSKDETLRTLLADLQELPDGGGWGQNAAPGTPGNSSKVTGWVAFYKDKKLEIPKSATINSLYAAKVFAIKEMKVPRSKEHTIAIGPAYDGEATPLDPAQTDGTVQVEATARKQAQRSTELKKCGDCGATKNLQRHHPDIKASGTNVKVLCAPCHTALHQRRGDRP